jgi:hypothetical protein
MAELDRGGRVYDALLAGGPPPADVTSEEYEAGRVLLDRLQQQCAAVVVDKAEADADEVQDDAPLPPTEATAGRHAVADEPADPTFGLAASGRPAPRTPGRPRY